jgi:4-alpha-glucanotransferase
VDGGSHTGVATPAVRVDRDAAWSYKLAALRSAYETRSGDDAFAVWRTEQGAPLEEFSVCTGGLRIDHVMGLFGLWWIPQGSDPTDGCYVRYPADDLLDIVCLESHRARAVVVGEDLGTVEDGVAEALEERGIFGYRVLWFEDDEFSDWPAQSLASVTTHDLPTVAGLWTSSDVDDQLSCSDMAEEDVRSGRAELVERLRRGGLPASADTVSAIVHAYARLGEAPSLPLALTLGGRPRWGAAAQRAGHYRSRQLGASRLRCRSTCSTRTPSPARCWPLSAAASRLSE